ncbi:hypothetical protein LT493_23365 [Streptomyces tricolor]|nr:hypothetical protein [Streptomyces tricolor]
MPATPLVCVVDSYGLSKNLVDAFLRRGAAVVRVQSTPGRPCHLPGPRSTCRTTATTSSTEETWPPRPARSRPTGPSLWLPAGRPSRTGRCTERVAGSAHQRHRAERRA